MSIIIFLGVIFLFVIPSYFLRFCSNSSETLANNRRCQFASYPSAKSILLFYSMWNCCLSLLIMLFMNKVTRCEVISFYVLEVVVFLSFLLIQLYLHSNEVSQSSQLSIFCYVASQIILLFSFIFRIPPRRMLPGRAETSSDAEASPALSERSLIETPPPPYTYFPGYESIPMYDLSQRPPPYQEPPPVYTSRENVGDEDETQFGENGSEEDPYEDMPPLED
ncbi:hypothetical protein [Candidatus Similichlamydia epinepheli]|uniref:hypothetical protein n=1 Tax=Candidatus Similichlamydia epinepheli TaxID=1903953 RepID=UPI000D348F7B|nr:hypothetical protein [Candidatus Similichlamydia epinepheli]